MQENEKESEFWNNAELPVFQIIVEFGILNADVSLLFPLVNYFSANNNSVLCFMVLGISWYKIEVTSRNKENVNE